MANNPKGINQYSKGMPSTKKVTSTLERRGMLAERDLKYLKSMPNRIKKQGKDMGYTKAQTIARVRQITADYIKGRRAEIRKANPGYDWKTGRNTGIVLSPKQIAEVKQRAVKQVPLNQRGWK